MASFKMPTNPENETQWADAIRASGSSGDRVAKYLDALRRREAVQAADWHTIAISLAYLQFDPDNRHLFTCVSCANSLVVDHDQFGRRLACGHTIHSACSASFPPDAKCPACHVPFSPASILPDTAVRHTEVSAASEILKASESNRENVIAEIKTDVSAAGIELDPVKQALQLLIKTGGSTEDVVIKATEVCTEEKQRLRERAFHVIKKYRTRLPCKTPFPPLPEPNTADPLAARGKQRQNLPPPDMMDDTLLPENTSLPRVQSMAGKMYTPRINDQVMVMAKWDKKCPECQRMMKAGQTVVTCADNKWVCSLCGLGMTSKAAFDEITRIANERTSWKPNTGYPQSGDTGNSGHSQSASSSPPAVAMGNEVTMEDSGFSFGI